MDPDMETKLVGIRIDEEAPTAHVRTRPLLMLMTRTSYTHGTLLRNVSTEPLLVGFVLLIHTMIARVEIPISPI